jgi:ABC-type transporter Mla subunit MlaD
MKTNPAVARPTFVCLSVFLFYGCASLNCDPSVETSILTKAGCEFGSDGYDAREERLKLTLAEQREINQSLNEVYAAISQEQKQVSAKLANRQQEYDRLNRSLNTLLAHLKARAADNTALQNRIRATENKLVDVNTDTSKSSLKKQQLLEDLRREVASLEEALGY